jgi:hypothetical protein
MIVLKTLPVLYFKCNKTTTVDLKTEVLYSMKKSSFAAMILGTASGVLFALGMCMALIPEWNAGQSGIVIGGTGVLLALVTVFVWRRMEHKGPIRISGKAVLSIVVGIAGALALGVGMCLSMVWDRLVAGIGIGLFGILILLCLIPLTKGIKD